MPDSQPPAPMPPGGSNLPARRLSSTELEAVIKRAVELQTAREDLMTDGLTEAEVIRIGKDLGLESHLVRRAIADVRSQPPEERGMAAALIGPGTLRAARTIRRPAVETGMFIERYLKECEFMVVERRFPDRTRYVHASGVGAAIGRAFGRAGSRQATLDLRQLDVGVAVADEDSCLVEVSVDMNAARTGAALGSVLGGTGVGGGVALVVLASTAPHLLALLGIPVLAGAVLGTRGVWSVVARQTQNKLEGFLDRLEHGELRLPEPSKKPDWRRQLGI